MIITELTVMNGEIPQETLDTTLIGLEYQQTTLSRLQFNTQVWISLIFATVTAVTVVVDALPAIFGEGILGVVIVCVWLVLTGVQMHLEYVRKRNDLYFRRKRLLLHLLREFKSDDPDLDTITAEDVRL